MLVPSVCPVWSPGPGLGSLMDGKGTRRAELLLLGIQLTGESWRVEGFSRHFPLSCLPFKLSSSSKKLQGLLGSLSRS